MLSFELSKSDVLLPSLSYLLRDEKMLFVDSAVPPLDMGSSLTAVFWKDDSFILVN